MKIAVLTYNLGLNYGGILQSYALIEKLKRLKHEPELLFIKTSYKPSWKGLIKKAILSIFLVNIKTYMMVASTGILFIS